MQVKKIAFWTALGLAAITAPISVMGLAAIFTPAFLPIGVGLEIGKLVTAAFLHRAKCHHVCRIVLYAILGVLMILTAFGLAGYMSRAYLDHQAEIGGVSQHHLVHASAKLESQEQIVARLGSDVAQINTAISEATQRGRSNAAMKLRSKHVVERKELEARLRQAEQIVVGLKVERAGAETLRKRSESETGSIRHIAALFGVTVEVEQIVRVLTLLIAIVFELLTILLLVAGTTKRQRAQRIKRNRNAPLKKARRRPAQIVNLREAA